MTHDAMRKQVFALYDGELAGEARQAAQAHLRQCSECQEAIAGWKRTAGVFFRSPKVRGSEAFVDRVLNRIASAERAPAVSAWKPSIRWLIPALGLVALLLVMRVGSQPVSLDALLLTDGEERGVELVLARESPGLDTVLDAVLEGSR